MPRLEKLFAPPVHRLRLFLADKKKKRVTSATAPTLCACSLGRFFLLYRERRVTRLEQKYSSLLRGVLTECQIRHVVRFLRLLLFL